MTEAVQRVVELARSLAEQEGRGCQPADLLKAIWLDESRGHELLIQCGINPEWFPPADNDSNVDPDFPAGLLRQMSSEARRRGGTTDLGTEHLLLAMLCSIPALLEWSRTVGLSLDLLRKTVTTGPSEEESGSIDTDLRLKMVDVSTREQVLMDRAIDAAANRGREALRVLEDIARFLLNDGVLSEELKRLRHALQHHLNRFRLNNLVLARDPAGDVGARITLPSEMTRAGLEQVIRSNSARAQEAFRSLEELGKLQDAEFAAAIEQLRYRVYALETVLVRPFHLDDRLRQARLYLLVSDSQCLRPIGEVIRVACSHGVDIVQLREKHLSDRRLCELASYVREWTAKAGSLFIVNDRPDIAAAVGADGVHLGQDDLEVIEARRLIGVDKLIGVSTHSLDQLQQAVLDGADYLGVGPVFSSTTKQFEHLAGPDFVHEAVIADTSVPWFAIGGITRENLGQLLNWGCRRIAVSGAICGSPDVRETVRELRALLDEGATKENNSGEEQRE